jgi:hypothetical protein
MMHFAQSDQNNEWPWNKTGLDRQSVLQVLRTAIIGVLLTA